MVKGYYSISTCDLVLVPKFSVNGFLHLHEFDEGESFYCDRLAWNFHEFILLSLFVIKIYLDGRTSCRN